MLLQPVRTKSSAKEALQAYLALIHAQFPGIELNLRLSFKDIKVHGLSIFSNDQGGEFTTTYGATLFEFNSLLNDVARRSNTPKTPKSGTSQIERA